MAPALPTRARPALSEERIVDAARALLVEGGPERVVVRELARRLDVAPSSLYKHVAGRDDVLTLLITTLYHEVATSCERARDAEPAGAHRARLRAASLALRHWALANRRPFDLLLGTPLPGYTAPENGPTDGAARRFGLVFAEIYAEAAQAGVLRRPAGPELSAAVRDSLVDNAKGPEVSLPVEQRYLFVVGWQRLLGLITVEAAGQLDWGLTVTEPFVLDQLDQLADELLLPDTG